MINPIYTLYWVFIWVPIPFKNRVPPGGVKQRARGPDGKNGGAEASPFGEFFSWCRGNLCTAPAWYAAATGHGGAKHRGGSVGRLVGRPVATWGWWLLKVVFNKKKWTVKTTRCWWIKYLFFFHPETLGKWSNLTSICLKGVETTN